MHRKCEELSHWFQQFIMASPSLCAPTGLGAECYPVPDRKKPAADGGEVEMLWRRSLCAEGEKHLGWVSSCLLIMCKGTNVSVL